MPNYGLQQHLCMAPGTSSSWRKRRPSVLKLQIDGILRGNLRFSVDSWSMCSVKMRINSYQMLSAQAVTALCQGQSSSCITLPNNPNKWVAYSHSVLAQMPKDPSSTPNVRIAKYFLPRRRCATNTSVEGMDKLAPASTQPKLYSNFIKL